MKPDSPLRIIRDREDSSSEYDGCDSKIRGRMVTIRLKVKNEGLRPAENFSYSIHSGQGRSYGSMYADETTPDGYKVGVDGAWIP